MLSLYILVTVVPVDPTIRLIRIGPNGDPSVEPLLSHAGLIINDEWHAVVAPQGLTGVSRKLRRFLTRVWNDWDDKEMQRLADVINMDGPDDYSAVARGEHAR